MNQSVTKKQNMTLTTKNRKPLFRVEIVPSDNAALLEKIKSDLIDKSGTPKQAIIDLYHFAQKQGYFNK